MDLRSRLVTALLAVIGVVAAGAWSARFLPPLPSLVAAPERLVLPAAALIAGGVLYGLLRRYAPVLPVLEHELAHGAVALVLLGRTVEIRASEQDGHAVHTAVGIRGSLVRLAPYVLPTVPLVVLPFGWLLRAELLVAWRAVLGLAIGYQLARVVADLHTGQPDLRRGGLLASLVAVLSWGSIAFGSLLVLLVAG